MKFTLQLYTNPFLSRKAIDDVLEMFDKFLSQTFVPYIQNQMESSIKSISKACFFKANLILESNKNILQTYSSEYQRFNAYQENYSFVLPKMFEIGEENVRVHEHDEQVNIKKSKVFAPYVPLKKTLEAAFSRLGFYDEVMKYLNILSTSSDELSNFTQAELWQKKYVPKFNGKTVLPLQLKTGEFETGNPLGSHAGEQKLCGIYVSLACLPPHLSGKADNIYISTVYYSKHLKAFGNEKIFSRCIQDLISLSKEGITIKINGRDVTLYFECVQILGDNLGINSVCGFSESFSANYFCRICCASKSVCQNMVVEDTKCIRSITQYELNVLENNF